MDPPPSRSPAEVYVLRSRPLPAELPQEVTAAASACELLEVMRDGDFTGDVHLVGASRTSQAFRQIDALDQFEVVVLPILATACRSQRPGRSRSG